MGSPSQEITALENSLQVKMRQGSKKSVKVVVQGEKSTELENLEITLEAVPVHCAFTDL